MDARDACAGCGVASSSRSCPQCGARVCALACYRAHNGGRCAERFRERELANALRGERVSEDARESVREVLLRCAVAKNGAHPLEDASEDEDEDEDEVGVDGERCALSEASLERLRLGGELELDELNDEERERFERALASGSLFEMWTPWWESVEAGLARASARGSRAVESADESEVTQAAGEDTAGGVPPLASAMELLEPFEALSGGRDAPEVLRWHCVNALAAYVLVKRLYNGDWSGHELEACETMINLSVVLSAERGAIAEAQCAADAVLDVILRAAAALGSAVDARRAHAAAARDVLAVFSHGPSACVRAFLDLIRALDAAQRIRSSTGASRRARARLKARYLAAHLAADARGDVTARVTAALRDVTARDFHSTDDARSERATPARDAVHRARARDDAENIITS